MVPTFEMIQANNKREIAARQAARRLRTAARKAAAQQTS
jgi:hypothetical protein